MTLERAKWWAELPKEERKVREAILMTRSNIRFAKFVLKNPNMNALTRRHYLEAIAHQKVLLMALKKQIAMRPHIDNTKKLSPYLCPHCSAGLLMYLPHCAYCGQHLDWRDVK